MKDKYLITITIPVYNDIPGLKFTLDSINRQYYVRRKIEVIIIDDNSTDNYDELIANYKHLNIKKILNTSGYKGPGPARQCGVNIAQGKWIFPMDAGDGVYKYGLLPLYFITKYKKHEYPMICCHMLTEFLVDGQDYFTEKRCANDASWAWLHGNVYLKKFWQDNNIGFKPDLYTHEDVYINAVMRNYIFAKEYDPDFKMIKMYNITPYHYRVVANSMTQSLYENDLSYSIYYLEDFTRAIAEGCVDSFEKWGVSDFGYELLKSVFIQSYFNHQMYYEAVGDRMMFLNPYKVYSKILDVIEQYFEVDYIDDFLKDAQSYTFLRDKTAKEVGLFIETETFRDFIFKCLLAREDAICENNI